ncbi:polysaccharide deacetylase family protein [Sulfurimonas sp. HSL1-6]|uniref:polysaccharide deacetylase family protein n=1 Tax=Thiomicrolovo immobilis TaxID=3131935 RepID=UPI0031F7E8E6
MRSLLLTALLPLILFADAHIFVFHRFGDAQHAATNTSIQTLRAEFDYLKTNGYEVIPLSRLAKALKAHEPIDDKWVVLTIDDSYKSFYQNALPVFREYGYPFTLFVYVAAADKHYGDFMTWEEIRDTAQYGELGLHGYGHRHECHLVPYMLKDDTDRGLLSFAKELRRVPRYYAYPYGEYNPEVKAGIAGYGFELILNQNSGAVNADSDPHDLDRTALTGENLIAQKLKIERLDTEWIAPLRWPEDGRLKEIHAKIAPTYRTAEYFISGGEWVRVPVKNGEIRVKTDVKLALPRSRVFIRVGRKQASIILVKE